MRDGSEDVIFTPEGEWASLGLAVDASRRVLWVCARMQDASAYEVWRFDLATDTRSATIQLPEAPEDAVAQCNDIAVADDGFAYVTDSSQPRVYRIDPDDNSAGVWADDPILGTAGGNFGLNGILVTDDQSYVIVGKTVGGDNSFVRIDRGDPTSLTAIATTPPVPDPTMEFGDGITMLNGEIYWALPTAMRAAKLSSTDDWITATATFTPATTGLSSVITAEGRAYAVYSDIVIALAGGDLTPPFRLYRIDDEVFE